MDQIISASRLLPSLRKNSILHILVGWWAMTTHLLVSRNMNYLT